MGCGCNSNFSGGETFAENRYKPYRTNKSLQQQISENKVKYNSFMGFNAKSPIVDTKKYGIPDEYYYEFNTSTGRIPINRNDMNVEF